MYDFVSTFGQGFRILVISKHGCPSLRANVLALPSLSFFCHILLPLFSSRPRFDYFNALLSLLSPAPRLPSRLNREANFQLFSNMKFHASSATICHSLGQFLNIAQPPDFGFTCKWGWSKNKHRISVKDRPQITHRNVNVGKSIIKFEEYISGSFKM